jgi:hypothetical protein
LYHSPNGPVQNVNQCVILNTHITQPNNNTKKDNRLETVEDDILGVADLLVDKERFDVRSLIA